MYRAYFEYLNIHALSNIYVSSRFPFPLVNRLGLHSHKHEHTNVTYETNIYSKVLGCVLFLGSFSFFGFTPQYKLTTKQIFPFLFHNFSTPIFFFHAQKHILNSTKPNIKRYQRNNLTNQVIAFKT